jgi:3-hydroxymyristoyl/3-hydroxydecanoyl-(acyl carrier protein) dehydratase
MDREALKNLLPHREPMLLIDEAEKVDAENAIGKYSDIFQAIRLFLALFFVK